MKPTSPMTDPNPTLLGYKPKPLPKPNRFRRWLQWLGIIPCVSLCMLLHGQFLAPSFGVVANFPLPGTVQAAGATPSLGVPVFLPSVTATRPAGCACVTTNGVRAGCLLRFLNGTPTTQTCAADGSFKCVAGQRLSFVAFFPAALPSGTQMSLEVNF